MLPTINVTGNGSYNWGVGAGLVNSVKLTFTSVSGSGTLVGSLLDPANALAPSTARLGQVVGLWDFDTTTFSFNALDATFRYDNALAGAGESSLKLYEYESGAWVQLATTLDTVNHLADASGLSSAGFFVVVVPEPSSLALCAIGLLSLLGFRAWRKW